MWTFQAPKIKELAEHAYMHTCKNTDENTDRQAERQAVHESLSWNAQFKHNLSIEIEFCHENRIIIKKSERISIKTKTKRQKI